jgi:hypothetical protein
MAYVCQKLTKSVFWVIIKTQFASIEVHIATCELLCSVKDNYMPGLKVTDEGRYWETGDREKLAMHLGFISGKMRELMETKLEEFKYLFKNNSAFLWPFYS